MTKKQKRQQNAKTRDKRISKYTVILIVSLGVIISLIVYFGIMSLVPVNGKSPVFAAPTNTFVKAIHSPQAGWVFTSQSTSGSRISTGAGYNSPTVLLKKGELESIHLINEDSDTHSVHNLNIDAFNVHTRNLAYFQSQTVTFIANKNGTFDYYCTVHPEMKGRIEVR
jgi:plastocyanin